MLIACYWQPTERGCLKEISCRASDGRDWHRPLDVLCPFSASVVCQRKTRLRAMAVVEARADALLAWRAIGHPEEDCVESAGPERTSEIGVAEVGNQRDEEKECNEQDAARAASPK